MFTKFNQIEAALPESSAKKVDPLPKSIHDATFSPPVGDWSLEKGSTGGLKRCIMYGPRQQIHPFCTGLRECCPNPTKPDNVRGGESIPWKRAPYLYKIVWLRCPCSDRLDCEYLNSQYVILYFPWGGAEEHIQHLLTGVLTNYTWRTQQKDTFWSAYCQGTVWIKGIVQSGQLF